MNLLINVRITIYKQSKETKTIIILIIFRWISGLGSEIRWIWCIQWLYQLLCSKIRWIVWRERLCFLLARVLIFIDKPLNKEINVKIKNKCVCFLMIKYWKKVILKYVNLLSFTIIIEIANQGFLGVIWSFIFFRCQLFLNLSVRVYLKPR